MRGIHSEEGARLPLRNLAYVVAEYQATTDAMRANGAGMAQTILSRNNITQRLLASMCPSTRAMVHFWHVIGTLERQQRNG